MRTHTPQLTKSLAKNKAVLNYLYKKLTSIVKAARRPTPVNQVTHTDSNLDPKSTELCG